MARRVRGVLTVENEQTGDGRVVAPGATTWIDPPMPIAWLADGDQHVDLVEVAPTVGVMDSITRVGNEIQFTGEVDDEQEHGAEVVRRLEAGTATHGNRFGISMDPDDWEVEIIATDVEEDEMLLLASGSGALPASGALIAAARTATATTAAAGDPDPGDNGGDGVILFSDNSGAIIERYTRLRARGGTLCAVPAFAGAYMELDGEADPATAADPAAEPVAASAVDGAPALLRGLFPPNPPAEFFRPITAEPDGSLNIVATGSEAGYAWGYHAAWDTCHTGYTDRCVTAPREVDYTPFHTGSVELADGQLIACGVLTWGIPHANLNQSMIAAQEHYGHSDAMFARCVTGANEFGIWFAGALRASVTQDDVSDLRALSMSGDWRWSQQSESLRMIASTAVNYPGFPVPRRSAMAAAARIPSMDRLVASVHMDGNRIMAMTSAGVLAPVTAAAGGPAPCGCHDGPSEELTLLRRLDQRTRHMIPDAVAAAAAGIVASAPPRPPKYTLPTR